MKVLVGVGDLKISDNPDDILTTFALATCVGLTAYSPETRVMGMTHIMLPHAPSYTVGMQNPGKYADTAVAALLSLMVRRFMCPASTLELRMFGGAESVLSTQGSGLFNIGPRNTDTVISELFRMKMLSSVKQKEVGGHHYRTLYAEASSGNVIVTTGQLV